MPRTRHQLALLLALLLASTACGGSSPPTRTTTPEGEAVARVVGDIDARTNTMRLAIEIADLRFPSDLAPDATAFVMWYRRDAGEAWSSLGRLEYDPETRHARLADITVAGTSFDLIVSLEIDDMPVAPSSWILFAQAVSG